MDTHGTELEATIRRIATDLGVLEADDRLADLDSLTLVDFVVALEEARPVGLLGTEFQRQDFQSIASVVALIHRLG